MGANMRSGRKPYGCYTDERAVIEVILLKARRRKGAEAPPGPWLIARELNNEGYAGPTGKAWNGLSVKRILKRQSQTSSVKAPDRTKGRKKLSLESKDYLTPQEVALCRAAERGNENLIFEVLLGAGLRAEELCDLDVRDLGIRHGQSQIDVVCGKLSRNRSVKIGPGLRVLLEQELETRKDRPGRAPLFADDDGRRLKYRTLYERMVSLGKRSGLTKRLHPHVLRHTFGSGLYHYKKDLEYVRKQLGHASIATTQIYVKVFDEGQLEQMAGFERLFGLSEALLKL
jgi:site-specific recombinase XerC